MGLELLLVGCTVTTVHRFSRFTREHVAHADIVVSATGKAGLITADWVKPGAIVIDVGIVAQATARFAGMYATTKSPSVPVGSRRFPAVSGP